MTAEIAVMNKSAVALAADSAVTISRGGRPQKTYEVNKLFTLSKHHPVGIMIFDNASILGVPWETAIKAYRKRLGKSHFPTIKDYANDFLNFLAAFKPLFPDALQAGHFHTGLLVRFREIQSGIAQAVKAITDEDGTIETDRILEIRSEKIREMRDALLSESRIEELNPEFESSLKATYAAEIASAITDGLWRQESA